MKAVCEAVCCLENNDGAVCDHALGDRIYGRPKRNPLFGHEKRPPRGPFLPLQSKDTTKKEEKQIATFVPLPHQSVKLENLGSGGEDSSSPSRTCHDYPNFNAEYYFSISIQPDSRTLSEKSPYYIAHRGRCPLFKLLHLQRDASVPRYPGRRSLRSLAAGLRTLPPAEVEGWPSAILRLKPRCSLFAARMYPRYKNEICRHGTGAQPRFFGKE